MLMRVALVALAVLQAVPFTRIVPPSLRPTRAYSPADMAMVTMPLSTTKVQGVAS